MRFSEKFALHRRPAWEQHYLPYDRLKVLLKKAASKPCPTEFREFEFCLHGSTSVLDSFFRQHWELLNHKEQILRNQYDLDRIGSGRLLLHHRDLQDLQTFYTQQLNDYQELQMFSRANQEAFDRVQKKANKIEEHLATTWNNHFSEERCLEQIERLQNLLSVIDSEYLLVSDAPSDRGIVTLPSSEVLQQSAEKVNENTLSPTNLSEASPKSLPSEILQELGELSWQPQNFLDTLRESAQDALELSISLRAWKCALFLLNSGFISEASVREEHLNDLIGIAGRNFSPFRRAASNAETVEQEAIEIGNVFHLLLCHLKGGRPGYLLTTDGFMRLPLHYCTESGLLGICSSMQDFAREDRHGSSKSLTDIILTEDNEGLTPFDLAVIQGHHEIARMYFSVLESENSFQLPTLKSTLGHFLLIAIKSQDDAMVKLIVEKDIDIKYQSCQNGETAFHAAAQLGREDYVRVLLKVARRQNANIDIPDAIRSWTPLFVAAAKGILPIVELFINVGADQTWVDNDGWTSQEHAAFRGHLAVAERLYTSQIATISAPFRGALIVSEAQKCNLPARFSGFIFNLGPMQQNRQAVDRDFEHFQQKFPNAALSLEVVSLSKFSNGRIFRYPFFDDLVSCDLLLPSEDPDQERILFKLWRATSKGGVKGTLLGSGAATLYDNRACFGSQRESLIRENSVNILDKETLDFLGSISFTFVKITPFPELDIPTPSNWNSVQIHGHRGNGQNLGNQKYLQLGENTIGSFLSAAKHGATHVEFDVQVTRDLVPVLYHDFSLSESGTDVPIHGLTYQQFMYASNVQSPHGGPISMLGEVQSLQHAPQLPRVRSRSCLTYQEEGAKEVQDRIQHTVDYHAKGFKPNTRGRFVQDTFATLEEALLKVPEHVGFNIEIKYPRIHEALGAGVSPISLDLNTFIDTILDMIARCNRKSNFKRPIVLSSFTPEVCILLALKQRAFPVVFISNGGKLPVEDHDVRAANVQAAVRFARQWGLEGVIFAAEVFKICPGLIRRVRNKGLRCGSYGGLNGEVETIEAQVRAGADLLIADRVSLVKETVKRLEAETGSEQAG